MRFTRLLYTFISLFLSHFASAQIITTLAGNGIYGSSGDGGAATDAHLMSPSGVAVDKKGNVFFSDQNASTIRRVDRFGIITTLAGTGVAGYSGDGGAATDAKIYWPTGVAVDGLGNVLIADQFNNVIRRVDTVGNISTLAGTGTIGYSGDGGPATACQLWHPNDVAVDTVGNVFIADRDNNVIRKIATDGLVYTIAGTNVAGHGGDGGAATTAKLNFPSGICVDNRGNIFVADLYNDRVRKIDNSGIISTIAGTGITGYTGDGGPATAANLNRVTALSADRIGNIYFTDYYNYLIRKIDTSGIISTLGGNRVNGFSGDGGTAIHASISAIEGVAVDTFGNVYIADFYNSRIRKIAPLRASLTINNYNSSAKLKIYPNPCFSRKAYIEIVGIENRYYLKILNIFGAVVAEKITFPGRNEIDVSNLQPGVYTLLLDGNRKIADTKFVICK